MSDKFNLIRELKDSLNELNSLNRPQHTRYSNYGFPSKYEISDSVVKKLSFIGIFFILGTLLGLAISLIAKQNKK
ncbi:hypothetical protein LCGC14_0223800 [marine sediment metagenome]|uniref:Uncharacterized protein n=1 Tax=marine sediment metagenome TaxID=412755 RepID=A0A0F9UTK2_9ZZZZ